jgi:hypothetical protein
MTSNQHRGSSPVLIAATVLFAGCSQAPWTEANTCNLTKPPENSVRRIASQTPGEPTLLAFPDPKEVPADYNGCLNTWIATPGEDVRVVEARFVGGKVKWTRMGHGEVYCEYENDRVIKEQVDAQLKKQTEAASPKGSLDSQFCPPGEALVPSKWK